MSGHVFIFRGRSGSKVKLRRSTGGRLSLVIKRMKRGSFAWPSARDGKMFLTPAPLAMLRYRLAAALAVADLPDRAVFLFKN